MKGGLFFFSKKKHSQERSPRSKRLLSIRNLITVSSFGNTLTRLFTSTSCYFEFIFPFLTSTFCHFCIFQKKKIVPCVVGTRVPMVLFQLAHVEQHGAQPDKDIRTQPTTVSSKRDINFVSIIPHVW